MGLSLRGQTSGAVDINAPAVAGDNTITLPDGNGSANQFYKNSTTAGIVTHSSLVEDSSGNVGINTITFPANGTNLKVSDGTISRLGLDKTGANARSFTIVNSGTILNVYDETADAERLRITSTGGVGVNTTTVSAGVNVAVGGTIRVQDSTDATQYLTINHQGINFQNTGAGSSTTSTAHLLDDSEEGTWSPKAQSGATGFTTTRCFYTKIGSQVKLYYSGPIIGGSASKLTISNLPFASDTTTDTGTQSGVESVGSVMLNAPSLPAAVSGSLVCYVWDSTINIYMTRQGANWEPLDGDEAGNNMMFSVTYKAVS